MEIDGLSKQTIDNTRKYLTAISQHTDISNPEQVKAFIARKQCSDGHKKILAYAYKRYANYYKLPYTMPRFHPKSRHIKIPSKQQIARAFLVSAKPISTKTDNQKQSICKEQDGTFSPAYFLT